MRQAHGHTPSCPRRGGVELERPVDEGKPLAHANESERCLVLRVRLREAAPIVGHRELDAVTVPAKPHLTQFARACLAMFVNAPGAAR